MVRHTYPHAPEEWLPHTGRLYMPYIPPPGQLYETQRGLSYYDPNTGFRRESQAKLSQPPEAERHVPAHSNPPEIAGMVSNPSTTSVQPTLPAQSQLATLTERRRKGGIFRRNGRKS